LYHLGDQHPLGPRSGWVCGAPRKPHGGAPWKPQLPRTIRQVSKTESWSRLQLPLNLREGLGLHYDPMPVLTWMAANLRLQGPRVDWAFGAPRKPHCGAPGKPIDRVPFEGSCLRGLDKSIGLSVLLGSRIAVLRGSRLTTHHSWDQHLRGLGFNYL